MSDADWTRTDNKSRIFASAIEGIQMETFGGSMALNDRSNPFDPPLIPRSAEKKIVAAIERGLRAKAYSVNRKRIVMFIEWRDSLWWAIGVVSVYDDDKTTSDNEPGLWTSVRDK